MSRWFVLGVTLASLACSERGDESPSGSGGEGSGAEGAGTLTFDEYDWFAVQAYLGVVQYDLTTATKRRLADGRQPWTHPSGATVFLQDCGDRVSRVVVRGTDGLVDVLSPCSSELPAREFSAPDFGVAKLSPDGTTVAVETWHYVDFEYEVATSVFRNGEFAAEIDGVYGPEWTPDGQLVLAGEGLFLTEEPFDVLSRIDDDQINAFVGNPAVDPTGERIAFEFNQQIWQIGLDGSGLEEWIVGSRRLRYPTWSPDGSVLAYLGVEQSDYYDKGIYFTEVADGEGTYLDLTPVLGTDPSVVPNGPLSWR